MKESDKLSTLRDALLAQDSPSPTRASAHQEILFAKIHRRMQMQKVIVGATATAVFLVALSSFLKAGSVRDATNAVWWTACSMHLLLWFLVFFLWHVERLIWRILPVAGRTGQTRGENWAVFIAALAACALGTGFLVQAAFAQNPLRIAQSAAYILWCPVFHLFWYPLGVATAAARLWLKFREMELKTSGGEAVGSPPPAKESSAGEQRSDMPPHE